MPLSRVLCRLGILVCRCVTCVSALTVQLCSPRVAFHRLPCVNVYPCVFTPLLLSLSGLGPILMTSPSLDIIFFKDHLSKQIPFTGAGGQDFNMAVEGTQPNAVPPPMCLLHTHQACESLPSPCYTDQGFDCCLSSGDFPFKNLQTILLEHKTNLNMQPCPHFSRIDLKVLI